MRMGVGIHWRRRAQLTWEAGGSRRLKKTRFYNMGEKSEGHGRIEVQEKAEDYENKKKKKKSREKIRLDNMGKNRRSEKRNDGHTTW